MAAITSFTTPRRAPRKVKMAVTIFGSGCLCGHRLRGNFKLATPYVVANQARVTFAGRSEPVFAQSDHEQHPRCASGRHHLVLYAPRSLPFGSCSQVACN